MNKMKRILKVTIHQDIDTDPDTSWLGEYSNSRTSEFSIDRCDCGGNWNSREYRYFNPSFNYIDESGKALSENTPDEVREYVRQDYKRMESLNNGQWSFIGIYATAEYVSQNCICQKVRSGGLWGIESDSGDSYIESEEQNQLAELRAELKSVGFSTRQISAAFKNVERED